MTKKEENLQKVYSVNFLKWENYLSGIIDKIEYQLHKSRIKFSIKSRIKTVESLRIKQNQLKEDAEGNEVKDLLGLRTIVPFLEDVESIIKIIQNNFHVIEIERKSENLSYREFAYDSVHLIISIDDENFVLPQHCLRGCEIQIRTILQEAWAEVEHELLYKSKFRFYNESIRKKMAALNANLTLSDMIFQEIRYAQKKQERWGRERFQELKKKATQVSSDNIKNFTEEKLISAKTDSSDTAHVVDKKFDTVFLQALDEHNMKNYRKAINLYSEVLKLNPDLKICSIVYNHRGMANFMLQLESQALEDFEMSFYCDSTNYRALNNRALVLRRMGLTLEALEDFKISLDIKEDQSEVYYLRAQTNFETKNYHNSLEDLKVALQLDPNYAEAIDLMKEVSQRITEDLGDSKER